MIKWHVLAGLFLGSYQVLHLAAISMLVCWYVTTVVPRVASRATDIPLTSSTRMAEIAWFAKMFVSLDNSTFQVFFNTSKHITYRSRTLKLLLYRYIT